MHNNTNIKLRMIKDTNMLKKTTINVNNGNNPTEFESCILNKYILIKYFVSTDQNDIASIQSRPKCKLCRCDHRDVNIYNPHRKTMKIMHHRNIQNTGYKTNLQKNSRRYSIFQSLAKPNKLFSRCLSVPMSFSTLNMYYFKFLRNMSKSRKFVMIHMAPNNVQQSGQSGTHLPAFFFCKWKKVTIKLPIGLCLRLKKYTNIQLQKLSIFRQ
ncbi:hypothetical protein AGLY_005395 [Aphis glycines]|uniref:Uncharacterized protein n=1 Tax=Aphis glycines TaxID=307491 RepID=A0A6G0TW86_APHGL|nr:hypothetical protein AGLY_005395 [Aphis glycines]